MRTVILILLAPILFTLAALSWGFMIFVLVQFYKALKIIGKKTDDIEQEEEPKK